jgi:hypothetical protein
VDDYKIGSRRGERQRNMSGKLKAEFWDKLKEEKTYFAISFLVYKILETICVIGIVVYLYIYGVFDFAADDSDHDSSQDGNEISVAKIGSYNKSMGVFRFEDTEYENVCYFIEGLKTLSCQPIRVPMQPKSESYLQNITLAEFNIDHNWINLLLSEYIAEQRNWFQQKNRTILIEAQATPEVEVFQAEVEFRGDEIVRLSTEITGDIEPIDRSTCYELHSEFYDCENFPEIPDPILERRHDLYLWLNYYYGHITYWILFFEGDRWWFLEVEGRAYAELGLSSDSSFATPVP